MCSQMSIAEQLAHKAEDVKVLIQTRGVVVNLLKRLFDKNKTGFATTVGGGGNFVDAPFCVFKMCVWGELAALV